ncbi:MAG: hypothetical protein CVV64_10870 [Candidatus Wallbacteria bacterium HGW-Wallbacteria-1]|jgi:2',3'-cyclic-nucleotide 2'-phosphodiesterase (5'-nucleotidase family)|uniref:Multifunctional 2',3'-cyclic-nucleotide 2'-phosphodiesterase/5'-nucleotidase/3'-nucleotidase n=1 Tax=Candidatus Wallbacteria bacterium HGW-Wallbacteria-1 TaxID=2013854 RepID=A0A2N1PPL3_9BACT|nr:MAG: hypothetical protein CVV64_10870 [Candidatus Wallbacteria bacterium HGW-Wallbacteria-1]
MKHFSFSWDMGSLYRGNSIFLSISLALIFSMAFQVCVFSGTLLVLHTNDIHGHMTPQPMTGGKGSMGGLPALSTALNAQRRKAALLGWETMTVDAGDFVQGTPYSDLSRGEDMALMAESLGYEFFTIGNHEFDFGKEHLSKLIPLTGAEFICTNLVVSDERGNDQPISGCKLFSVVERAGARIGIIGLMTTDLPAMTGKANIEGIKILDPAQTAVRAMTLCRESGATVIILLSHMGYGADIALADEVSGIDLIVGSHSHTAVSRPTVVIPGSGAVADPGSNQTNGSTDPMAQGALVTQTGSYTNYLGWARLNIDDRTHRVSGRTGGLILLDTSKFTADPKMVRKSSVVTDRVDALLGATVGIVENEMISAIPADLAAQTPAADDNERKSRFNQLKKSLEGNIEFILEPGSSRVVVLESTAGNFVADAMRWSVGADIAIQNGGGVRGGLTGKVLLSDLHRMMPFKNKVVMTRVNGKIVRILAERVVARYSYGLGVISGMEIIFDPAAPEMSRVVEVLVGGQPLDENRDYTVATNDFIFDGGDSYAEFRKCSRIDNIEEIEVREAMRRYLGEMSPYRCRVEGRIRTER